MKNSGYPANYNTYDFLGKLCCIPILRLIASNVCNLSCSYCHFFVHGKGNIREGNKLMPSDIAISSIMSYQNFLNHFYNAIKPIISIYGGEPLINSDTIIAICEKFRKSSLVFIINTNGTMISENILKSLPREAVDFHVSMDGPETLHNVERRFKSGRPTYSQVVKNIKLLKEFNFCCQANFMLTSSNVEYLDEFVDVLTGLGLDRVYIDVTREAYREMEILDLAKKIVSFIYECNTHNIKVGTPLRSLYYTLPLSSNEINSVKKDGNIKQFSPEMYVQVDANGRVSFPHHSGHEPIAFYYELENLRDLPNYKKVHNCSMAQMKYCNKCTIKKSCFGDIRNVWYYHYGTYEESDYACDTYRLIGAAIEKSMKKHKLMADTGA